MLFEEKEFISTCQLCKEIYQNYLLLETSTEKSKKIFYAKSLGNVLETYSKTVPSKIREEIGIDKKKLEAIIRLNLKQ